MSDAAHEPERLARTVAKHGNIQRAAEVLNLSRGAVSQRIKQLERDLGTPLLVRGARGVSLTPAGERCRAAMDEALAIFDTARGEIAVWPGTGPDPNPSHESSHLAELRLVAVCSPDFLRPDWPMGPETLLTLPLLQDAHRRWDRLAEETKQRPKHGPLNFDRSALALDAAVNGHGIAIAPHYMIEADLRAGRLVEIWFPPEPSGEHLFLSWSKERDGGWRLRRAVNWLLNEFGQKPDRPD